MKVLSMKYQPINPHECEVDVRVLVSNEQYAVREIVPQQMPYSVVMRQVERKLGAYLTEQLFRGSL